jgi:transposase InsO family protein
MMVACVDAQRDTYGVESICAHLPIAPSTYWRHKAQEADPTRRAARVQRDAVLRPTIARVWHEQEQVYGAEKVWRQLKRDGVPVARCTVERLMKDLGLRGVVRGGPAVITTSPDATAAVPDLVDRQFSATRPNQLWVSDFTYVATAEGFVYTAFVIDVFARRIVGWKVAATMHTDFVLDALEQALHHPPRSGRDRALRRTSGRFLRQRPRRVGDRPLQDGRHRPPRPMAGARRRRVRDVAVGGLVQSSATLRADRLRATRRVRGALLSAGHRGLSHRTRPPRFPGRFN